MNREFGVDNLIPRSYTTYQIGFGLGRYKMPHPSIPEWDLEELPYTTAGTGNRYFGYQMRHQRGKEELEFGSRQAARLAFQDGEPAHQKVEFESIIEASEAMKSSALKFGADIVGICEVDPKYIFKGRVNTHKYAIAIGIAMDMEEILEAPRRATNAEYIRVYDAVGNTAVELSKHIRSLGYSARAHTLRDTDLTMIPFAYAAGLGELGKHGSLINKDLSSCFRISVVTTDLPLAIDHPANDGIDDMCTNCNMCVQYCPGDAISHEKQDVRGVMKWVVNTGKCAPFFSSHYACALCLRVCPWNARAFGKQYKEPFIKSIKELSKDWSTLSATLNEDLQEPWSLLPLEARPSPGGEGWA